VKTITKMLLWLIFLILPLLAGTILHFVTGGPTFDLYDCLSGYEGRNERALSVGESLWVGYGIIIELPWIIVSGLVLFSTVKPGD